MNYELLNQLEIQLEEEIETLTKLHDHLCDQAPDEIPIYEEGEIVGYEEPEEWKKIEEIAELITTKEYQLSSLYN